MAVNRLYWEEAVTIHAASDFYDVDGFRRGRCSLSPIERAALGDVAGKSLLHLQCHFGLDTLSLARRGAVVTGIDYAGAAIRQARQLSDETGIPASFIEASVYDVPKIVGQPFDIVFTSWGVLSWLADLAGWAHVIAASLKPDGRFYIAEGHPALHWFDDTAAADVPLAVTFDYLGDGRPELWDEPGTYADRTAEMANTREYSFRYSLAGVVSALAAAGLIIDELNEHDAIVWPALPQLVRHDDGMWRMPEGRPRIPLSFSIAAHKPA